MDAMTTMRGQLQQAHQLLEQAVSDLTSDQLHGRTPGSTVQPIAAIYAHTVLDEDMLVNGAIRGQAPVLAGGWAEKVGIDPGDGRLSDAWGESVHIADLPTVQAYAQAVYAETDRYLASLSESDLDQMTSTQLGDMPLGSFLANIIVWHAVHHGGEICAMKGQMGGKGLPF